MARIRAVCRLDDLPAEAGIAERKDLEDLFERVLPEESERAFTDSRLGWGVLAAQSPRFALEVARLTKFIASEMSWFGRSDLRELAIQAVNLHFKCEFSFRSHLKYAQAAGLGAERLAAIPYWRTTSLFTDEQRLAIEYAYAVAQGDVPDELFSRVADSFGEKQAIEATAVIAHWSFWAMMLNATRP